MLQTTNPVAAEWRGRWNVPRRAQASPFVAAEGINIRGVSAMTLGRNFVAYIGFDSAADATKAAKAIQSVDRPATRKEATKKKAAKKSSR